MPVFRGLAKAQICKMFLCDDEVLVYSFLQLVKAFDREKPTKRPPDYKQEVN